MREPSQELLDDLLTGEKAYPLFDIRTRWTQDRTEKDTDPAPWQTSGLPEGRLWNSICSHTKMPKHYDERALAHEHLTVWWPQYKGSEKNRDLNFADLRFSITFRRWEVWCIDWFQHWTWDVGLTDQQVLDSFGRYVLRTEVLNERARWEGAKHEPYCLMGAEDRYRWHGSKTGAPDEQIDPPCRCPYCKEQGVVRIAH